MKLGSTDVFKLYLGSSEVSKIMLGATEVWSNFDPDFSAYLAAGIVNGSTMGAANQTAVNAFIVGCKADGIWSAIKASCLLCAWDSLVGALTPLVGTAPTNVNFVSGDYSRTTGLIGDGSTKYLNSNRLGSSDPQDNSSICAYVTSYNSADQMLLSTSTTGNPKSLRLNGTAAFVALNAAAASLGTRTGGGFFGASRSSSANFQSLIFGTATTTTSTSGTPSNVGINIFNQPGARFSPSRISFYSIGESLDLALLDARLTTLMAALT